MTKRTVGVGLLAWVLALSAFGCGGSKSCEELCSLTEACPDVVPLGPSCKEQCVAQEELLKLTGCEEKRAVFDACRSELEDVCSAAQDCSTEAIASYDCIDDYCEANPGGSCGGS